MHFQFGQLREEIQKALKEMGFVKPTPIQEVAIPLALEGGDVLIQARTGTGKTGAFAIPILERIGQDERALVLAPTRELVIQLRDHMRDMARFLDVSIFAFYGGKPVARDLHILSTRTPKVIIGTPGRIKDLINRGVLKLERVRYLVLDEMDVMLDMGFREDIDWIVSRIPKDRQTFLVSATVPEEIKKVAARYMREGFDHVSADSEEMRPRINEIVLSLRDERQKIYELEKILRENQDRKILVFVKMRRNAKDLSLKLRRKGFKVSALHGDMTQRKREAVMRAFRRGEVKVLVATDVASRGLDIQGVSMIINYHIPEDPRVYTHRIGRTGRLGREGTAISLVSPSEKKNLWRIERFKEKSA